MPPSTSPRGRQTLRYLPTIWPSGPIRHRDVVDQVPVAFDQADDDVEVVLLRELAEVLGRWAGDRFGDLVERLAQAEIGDRFAEHDEVGLLPGGLGDERLEHPAIVHRRLAARRPKVDGGQTNLARRRRRRFGQRDVAPPHLAARGPAQVQLDDRPRRPRMGPGRCRRPRSSPAAVPARRGELRLGHRGRPPQVAADRRLIERDVPALSVPPVDLGHDAAPREVHALRRELRVRTGNGGPRSRGRSSSSSRPRRRRPALTTSTASRPGSSPGSQANSGRISSRARR